MKRCLLLALLISWSAYATIDAYEFDDYDEEQRFRVKKHDMHVEIKKTRQAR